ncbi:tyrosine protein kinase [Pelomonas sp. HMWF004]|nr:tyrosine protein kinase [Pelomonas sp. HMWF004]
MKTDVADRSIGSILANLRNLSAEQVEKIAAHQRDHGMRFGEAAVVLGFASSNDVMFALAQQFHYPYAAEGKTGANAELVTLNQPFGVQSESFRALRSQIMMRLFNEGQSRRAIALVSTDSGDGRTYVAANLAVALAQLGGRTLLVDADLRHPRLHEIFGLSNKSGLSGILSGRAEAKVIQQVAHVPSLFVLPVGNTPPNPLELLERPAFGLLMRELLSKFDHVVVDTPAACYGSDCAVIASRCGSALVVARKDKSQVSTLRDMVGSMSETPAAVVGVVFNQF